MKTGLGATRALLLLFIVLTGCKEKKDGAAEHDPTSSVASQQSGEEHDRDHPEASAERTIQITKEAIERSDIRMAEAEEMPIGRGVRVPAEVAPDPDRVVHVAPLVEGQIIEVPVSVGDRVEKGDVLAVLRSVAVGETRAAMSEAQAELAVAQANHERQQELFEEGIGAKQKLIEAEGALRTARARVAGLRSRTRVYGSGGSGATTLLRSTIAGEVVQRHAAAGEVASPDQTLFVVADTSPVWVMGSVYPQDIEAFREGVEVTFVSPDLPGRKWQAPLDWASPMLDESTRTLPVRLVLENPEGTLRPGLFGTLLVPGKTEGSAVTIADTGLAEIDGEQVVFVAGDEDGEFEARPVTTGGREEGRVEIVEGLAAGERYVTQGTFVLKSQLLRGKLGEGHAD